MKRRALGTLVVFLSGASLSSFLFSLWCLPSCDVLFGVSHALAKAKAEERGLSETAEFGLRKHCMFAISRWGGSRLEIQDEDLLQWYKASTMQSIKLASQGVSNYNDVVPVCVLLASRTIKKAVKEMRSEQKMIVGNTFSEIDFQVRKFVDSNQCTTISLMRLDIGDLLSQSSFENVRQGWETHCSSSSDCILHTAAYHAPNVVLQPHQLQDDYIPCTYTDFHMNGNGALSLGLTLSLSLHDWRKHFNGTVEAVFFDQHMHLLRFLLEQKPIRNRLKKNEVVYHGAQTITYASPKSSLTGMMAAGIEVCRHSDLNKVLGSSLGEILWNGRQSIPSLDPSPPKYSDASRLGTENIGWNGSLTIVIITNAETAMRFASLKRLMESLKVANYSLLQKGSEITLRVNMDTSTSDEVVNYIQDLNWPYGPKMVMRRVRPGGLIRAVAESWFPAATDDLGLFLEDDIEVSPLYYSWIHYSMKALRHTPPKIRKKVSGISLYTPRKVENHSKKKFRIDPSRLMERLTGDATSPYLQQLPCSWGAVYFGGHWREFLDYMHARLDLLEYMI